MNQVHPHEPIGRAEYFSLEEKSPIRHELIGGQLYAMTGDSAAHNHIVTNLAGLLKTHLRDGPCQVFASTFKLQIGDNFYYPDVFVTCKEPHQHYSDDAKLVIEVLSKSTERYDSTEKFEAYRALPGLQEYCLVAQDRRYVLVYRSKRSWQPETSENQVSLESIDLVVAMNAIYEGVA